MLSFLASLLTLIGCAQSTPDNMLSSHRWQHRVLLVFAPSADHPQLQDQQAQAEAAAAGYADRDLRSYQLSPTGGTRPDGEPLSAAEASAFYDRYQVAAEDFVVMLIGKDGGEKRRRHEVLTTQQLFETIDAMPMRQREMRERP
jgi:hypothetical protein